LSALRRFKLLQNGSAAVNARGRADAAATLVYFRNPFDDRFDIHREVGLQRRRSEDDPDLLARLWITVAVQERWAARGLRMSFGIV
jgi:hypothetical protein